MFRKPVRSRDGHAGFTLIELVVVIGAVALVMAILTLGIRRASDAFSLQRAATLVMSELRRAQARAVAEGVDYTVEFDVVTGSGTSTGLKIWKAGTATPVRTVQSEWPSNVQILDGPTNFPACTAPADPADDCATFKPMGYAAESGRMRLKVKSAAAEQIEIKVESATGRVSVTRL